MTFTKATFETSRDLARHFDQDVDFDSVDSSDSERKKKKESRKRKWRLHYDFTDREVYKQFCADPPRRDVGVSHGFKSSRSFMFMKNLLGPQEIARIHAAAAHQSVQQIHDRKDYLNFKHDAFRVEIPLRMLSPHVYEFLMAACRWADRELWGKIKDHKKCWPEIEYIVYDTEKHPKAHIEPHVDNYSLVTMVCLLSDRSEFTGGVNCFAKAALDGGSRHLALTQGDAVFFRGERLSHWITPVTSGKRVILQIELSRV